MPRNAATIDKNLGGFGISQGTPTSILADFVFPKIEAGPHGGGGLFRGKGRTPWLGRLFLEQQVESRFG